jgi:transcriptional regulator with XRE-family HTH domain
VNRELIAKFIKEQREVFSWSQRELGRKLGCPQATVHLWESAKSTPDTENLEKVANLFGLTLSQLFKLIEDGGIEIPPSSQKEIQDPPTATEVARRKALAIFLKQKRAEYSWSQRELAQRISSTQNAVYLWETERAIPDTVSLDKIAALFGLKTWQLLKSLEDINQSTEPGFDNALRALNFMSSQEIIKMIGICSEKLMQTIK